VTSHRNPARAEVSCSYDTAVNVFDLAVGQMLGKPRNQFTFLRDPITETENGGMEPKYALRLVSVIGHPLLII